MLALYMIILAIIVGGVASLGNMRSALLYVPVAGLGALFGALIAFGDVPFLVEHAYLNPFILSLLGSVSLVAVVRLYKAPGAPKR